MIRKIKSNVNGHASSTIPVTKVAAVNVKVRYVRVEFEMGCIPICVKFKY